MRRWIFLPESIFSADSLMVSIQLPLCIRVHLHLCAHQRSRCPCQSSVDYGNTETPRMHHRLGNVTATAGFSWGRQPEFPMGEIPLGQNSCKKLKKKKKKKYVSLSSRFCQFSLSACCDCRGVYVRSMCQPFMGVSARLTMSGMAFVPGYGCYEVCARSACPAVMIEEFVSGQCVPL